MADSLKDLQSLVTGETKKADPNANQAAATKPSDGADPEFGKKAITLAKSWLDVPYLSGGFDKNGIDAGGLVQVVYEKLSINFGTNYPVLQYKLFEDKKLTYTNKADIKAGDVVFFQGTDGITAGTVSTVGILIGDSNFIIASLTDKKVVTASLTAEFYAMHIKGYGRLTSNGALSLTAQAAAAAAAKKNASAAQDGHNVKTRPHAKHLDAKITKTPENKTFCEPVYPDLTVVVAEVPKYLLDGITQSQIANMKNVGDGVSVVSATELQANYGIDLSSIIGSATDVADRQHIFDPETHKNTRKKPNAGKPANNNDPYPVDLKIEELELHAPRIKISSLDLCEVTKADITIGKALLDVADRAEKRIVRLENMMSTLQRIIFRLGSRMSINCVYYGGQDKHQKYCGIRCLHDNRIDDGQCMSIDQCMNCTRYEPVFGQVYDILNDTGSNLAAILDDNQMAYMTMQNYIDGAKADKFHEERKKASIELASVKSRDLTAKDFKDYWPAGYKQDWTLTPVEQQKPGINWRQSLLDDGSNLKKLGSYQYNKANYGRSGTTLQAGAQAGMMKKQLEALNANTVAGLQQYIDEAKDAIYSGDCAKVTNTLAAVNQVGYENSIRNYCADKGLDPLIVLSLIIVESGGNPSAGVPEGGFWGCMQVDEDSIVDAYPNFTSMTSLEQANAGVDIGTVKYVSKADVTETKNPFVVCSSYNAGEGMFLGTDKSPEITNTSANTTTDKLGVSTKAFTWDTRDDWLYTDMGLSLLECVTDYYGSRKVTEVMKYFPMIVFAYDVLINSKKFSFFDAGDFAFPLMQSDLENNDVELTSCYGWRIDPVMNEQKFHNGVDIGGPDNMRIYAAADGTVVAAGDISDGFGCKVVISHANGSTTLYGHMSSKCVQEGDTIKKSDLIGYMGSSGISTGTHLHFSIFNSSDYYNNDGTGSVDPASVFPQLNVAEYTQIS